MAIYHKSGKLRECKFEKEIDFEKEVFLNHKFFFGENTIYIDTSKKLETKIGNARPDGFLFDLSDIHNPEFYIVEVELSKHDFYGHIFPQITKYIGYINLRSYETLITKIYEIIQENENLKSRFGEIKELYKFLKDTITNNSNILLVIDDIKPELNEMNSVYQEWNKKVKQIVIKKYENNNEIVYGLNPEFKDIEDIYINDDVVKQETDEAYHLLNTNNDVKTIYAEIKNKLLEYNSSLIFNPQKYYISIKYKKNFAFLKFKKQKIKIVLNIPYNEVKEAINDYYVQDLSESVQKFYFHKVNSCCAVVVNNLDNVDKVITMLKSLC